MKAIISVIGKDKVGIIAKTSNILAEKNGNILDINQTITNEYFTMFMAVSLEELNCEFIELKKSLENLGEEIGVSIRIQHQDIFDAMNDINFGGSK